MNFEERRELDLDRVPMADANLAQFFPVHTSHARGREVAHRDSSGHFVGQHSRAFLARRRGGARYHVGVDLWARYGDLVVAPAPCTVVNYHHFYRGTWALLVAIQGELTLNLAEVEYLSWRNFGLEIGSYVQAGSPLARVGRFSSGGSMVHVEAYADGVTASKRWHPGRPMPEGLRNPTDFLLAAARVDPTPAPRRVLREDDMGEAVRVLQARLNKLDWLDPPPDGYFGPKTRSAVRMFQEDRGLLVDGIVGPATWAELERSEPH